MPDQAPSASQAATTAAQRGAEATSQYLSPSRAIALRESPPFRIHNKPWPTIVTAVIVGIFLGRFTSH